MRASALCFTGLLSLPIVVAGAQQPLGSLKTDGVAVSGMVTVSGGRATIANTGSIETGVGAAEVSLSRGGSIRVCQGSSARLAQPALDVVRPPLLVALNRGTLELHTTAEKNDIIATPDFRLQVSDSAPLNVSVRLVANGDTCIDNAGKHAPILHATEAFGMGAYFIQPGQRVLFEHGSMREVVDHEGSSCGCPKTEPLVLAGKGKRGDGKVTEAARNNPFPEAESQGLVKPVVPQVPPDETHVQVSATLAYSGATNTVAGPPGQAAGSDVAASSATGSAAATVAPAGSAASTPALAGASTSAAHVESAAPPPAGPNPFRALGRFFRRMFRGKS